MSTPVVHFNRPSDCKRLRSGETVKSLFAAAMASPELGSGPTPQMHKEEIFLSSVYDDNEVHFLNGLVTLVNQPPDSNVDVSEACSFTNPVH